MAMAAKEDMILIVNKEIKTYVITWLQKRRTASNSILHIVRVKT